MSLSKEIIYRDVNSVQNYLQQHQPNINLIDEYGFTPLIQTAIMNDLEKAKLILSFGADVNQQDVTGGTALHWAVENHNLPLCQLLLELKANPNAYTTASQPILTKPLLREQRQLKKLLVEKGADLTFAQDFINTKLIGHRYELFGKTDIVDTNGEFTQVDFEGFFLEFSIGIIANSLMHYKNNFAAKNLKDTFDALEKIIKSFQVASELIKYQHYQIDIAEHKQWIDNLLSGEILIIPVVYEGHAITFIRMGNFLAKCDRSVNKDFKDNVVIYLINDPRNLTKSLIKGLIYSKKSKAFIDLELPRLLALKPLTRLDIQQQITGNCSWANVEACVPVIFFLNALSEESLSLEIAMKNAIEFFNAWREWDKDRALHYCIQQFRESNLARRVSKAAVLGAILFQRCDPDSPKDLERAKRIFPLLNNKNFKYIIDNYLDVYWNQHHTPKGDRFKKLIAHCEQHWAW